MTESTEGIVTFELDLPHPQKTVWRALTDPDLLAEWLLPTVGYELKRDARFTFMAPPQPDWDGTVNCRILDIEPMNRLRYSWIVGPLDTIVTFSLTPIESGTRLLLEQSGFKPDQKRNLGGARYGWRKMTSRLVELLQKTQLES